MLGELRLNAAKRAAPFSLPEALEVDQLDAGLAPRSPNDVYTVFPHHTARKFVPLSSEAVEVPMLVEPHCSDDLAIEAVGAYLIPAHFDAPSVLPITVGLGADVEVFDALAVLRSVMAISFPAVHDMTDPLGARPRIYGRTDSDDIASDQLSLTPFEAGAAASDCMHGQPRGSCDTCRRERAARQKKPLTKDKGVSIADVLELLWLYLQPPLDPKAFTSVFPFPSNKTLDPHQIEGIKFLQARTGALLADDVGLGKTAQAIVAARLLLRTVAVTRILVVAPKSLLTNWRTEWELWAQREVRVQVVDGTKEQRAQKWKVPAHVWIVSYETLREDLPTTQCLQKFDLVILDEAAKVKNPNAKITRAVRDLPRARCWALTATPLEGKIEDLESILRLIDVDDQVSEYVGDIIAAFPRWWWLPNLEKEKLMQPVMLRRRQKDVLRDLKVVGAELWLELTSEQRTAYDAAYRATRSEVKGMLSELDENRVRGHIFTRIQKLKELCNFDPDTGRSAKADFLVEYLREKVPDGDKVLVFSQYPKLSLPHLNKELIHNHFQMPDHVFEGKLTIPQRERLLGKFRDDPGYRVLLMSLRAGGMGLNLQEANHVVLFDHWWNPAVHEQAVGRAARKGQEKTVFVRSLFTVDTIEARIHDKLREKQKLFEIFVDDFSDAKFRERTDEEIERTDKVIEQSLTLEDLLEVLDLPLPEQRARQERIDTRVRGNDGRAAQIDSGPKSRTEQAFRRNDGGVAAARAISWSGSWDEKRLQELSPSEFEKLVAQLYRSRGYRADKTQDSRDGGVDVIAVSMATGAKQKLLIQCKHTKSDTVVGAPVVRELAGVLSNTPDATNAVVVTNGTFSRDAEREYQNSRVELVDRQRLIYLLGQFLNNHQST